MKLTIEHLAPYLPYGLKIYEPVQELELVMDLSTTYNTKNIGLPFLFFGGSYRVEYGLPILRPLGDLTFEQKDILNNKYDIQVLNEEKAFMFRDIDGNTNPLEWDYKDVQKLFEWHFDVFGLIDQGLAIDINTIES